MNPAPVVDPSSPGPSADPVQKKTASPAPRVPVPGGRPLAVFFGVLLPLFTLGFELVTGMSRDGFRNPIPTPAHAVFIAAVPLAHLLSLLALRASGRGPSLRLAANLNAFACAIGVAYALFFLLITPFAVMAILAFGLGLLPLAPLLSVIAALCLHAGLRRAGRARGVRLPAYWPAFLGGFLALALLETPSLLTRHAVDRVSHGSAAEQNGALRRLRAFAPLGVEGGLLRGSYGLSDGGLLPRARDGFLLDDTAGSTVNLENEFRLAYYRVTGRAFNSVPAPRRGAFALRGRAQEAEDSRDWTWDDSLGAQQVGRRLRALHLAESRLDARLESGAALGYLEWTLVFRNDHAFDQREARALIQLPPGAAVSRLTLWVNGQEREAAWGGPARVVQAYRSVAVVQRRDPVLVTSQGPDRVLMQCFPIPAGGGLMKVRLGVTLPLALAEAGRAHLLLPRIIEQNFSLADSVAHQLQVEADAPLASALASLKAEGSLARPSLRGPLSAADLFRGAAPLSLARAPSASLAWSPALRDPARIVTQTLRCQPPPSGEIALLVSGSAELAPAAESLANTLRRANSTPFSRLYHSGDAVAESPVRLDAVAQADWLAVRPFVGGQDDTEALAAALDALAARGGGTLVWLHGGQPLSWQNASALEQRLSRRGGAIRLISVPAVAAPNVLLEKIATSAPVSTFPRLADLNTDLARLVRELREGRLVAERSSRSAAGFVPTGRAASDHLSRLWVHDEVHRLLATGGAADRESAQQLAVSTQIVTPVSGAVVLETDAQYTANGLAAADPQNSPAVPEPATYGLLMSAALLAFTLLRRRRRLPA